MCCKINIVHSRVNVNPITKSEYAILSNLKLNSYLSTTPTVLSVMYNFMNIYLVLTYM